MKDSNSFPAVASTRRSICGKGKLSFGHALFQVESTFSSWDVIAGSIPFISAIDHAKRCTFCLSNVTSCSFIIVEVATDANAPFRTRFVDIHLVDEGRLWSLVVWKAWIHFLVCGRDDGLHLVEPWGAQNGVVNGWFIDDEEFGGFGCSADVDR
ncbi:unnamed protein product [Microthlaspi erraticum]|uniref:Uncharacterized protein n=1 Tax=Microthlaspi erraticum TaxID=1685480 RepID=A0A6D2JDJ7_9BRAS|nr:unnamed protein product [Microthlaspi erraticum]